METIGVRVTLEVPYKLLEPMLREKFAVPLFKAFLTGYLVRTDIRVSDVSISAYDVSRLKEAKDAKDAKEASDDTSKA